jgi:hypothetical protein
VEPADVEPAEPVDAADEPVADEAPDVVAEPAPAEPEAKPKRGRRKKISFV